MAAQQGFQYEKNAAEVLKPLGIVPKDFTPAGAGHDKPDLEIVKDGKTAGCELKITAASAGSLVLKYDNGQWKFGDIKSTEDEKLFIRDLANDIRLFDLIKKEWTEIPFKRTPEDAVLKSIKAKVPKQKIYERDRDMFKDIRGEIPASKIEDYYNKKDTYYVNVGTHGFYLFGNKNPLNLQGVPRFSSSAKATYRARVQYKGSGNYQFTFEMQFSMKTKSPFNIAPVTGTSVNILENKISLGCFF